MPTEPDDEAARDIRPPRRATEWLLALNEAPDDDALRRRFEAWRAEDPAHERDWLTTSHLFDQLGPALSPDLTGSGVMSAGTDRPDTALGSSAAIPLRRPAGRRGKFVLPALMLAAACVAAVLLTPDLLLRLRADQMTGVAEQRTITLADGSAIRLAPSAAVAIRYTGTQRAITLLRGEALFSVRHDPARPFTVTAGPVRTTDIGTTFDIRHEDQGATIAVCDGAVQVEDGTDGHAIRERLQAGDEIRISRNADGSPAFRRDTISPQEIALWTRSRAIIRDRTVKDAVDAIRPWFHGMIIVQLALARQPLTGVYTLSDPAAALAAVARAEDATMRQISPWIVVLSTR
ncbi:hypothetical protein CFR75_15705 [Komagataeibacter xylinus]|uniref:Histidine kinase n=1 Tax=Komagataeibacter xylinus TaxID=28448 RepID=A0A318PEJ2_KOMXY|nr:FecR domain-containing protein [Komagataeibacter xylinus]PYD55589.1 hypothetical protein CFR75_15705 [Komagataeibacter xylinus]GBQ70581.1 anti-FecI sigma factor FecR [Komagataeibacter xylinus NBRC 15237]